MSVYHEYYVKASHVRCYFQTILLLDNLMEEIIFIHILRLYISLYTCFPKIQYDFRHLNKIGT